MQQMVDAILYDQEGRNGLGLLHWIVYGIDASTTSLPEGAGDGERPGLVASRLSTVVTHESRRDEGMGA